LAHPAAPRPDRAFRSNSSDLPMQILRGFRCNPLRPTGYVRFAQFENPEFQRKKK
jgi:hypothetical protein